MTTAPLSNHGVNVVAQLANNEKRRREKTSVLTTLTPGGVTPISMYYNARTAVSYTGCIVSGNVAPKRGGV